MAPRRLGREQVALLALLAILALAALLRLPGLDQRGRWDADQGHDMLVLRALVTRGEVPLLGPPTSIGTFHHGAAYYYLLAPAAFLSGADPVAVTGEIALIGIAAVAAVWWLARLIGGPLAGLAAALLAAISPAGIDESTFLWNPNLVPLAAALAFGGAIRAWQTHRPRWWLLAATGAMITMQCHVLGVVVLPPLALAYLADVRRSRRLVDPALRPMLLAGLGGALVIAAGYIPLLAHELGHDFSETRAILDYIAGGGGSSDVGVVGRIAMVGLRSVTWPLAGLVSDRPNAADRGGGAGHGIDGPRVRGWSGRQRQRGSAWSPAACRRAHRNPGLVHRGAGALRAQPGRDHAGAPQRPLPRVPRPAGARAGRHRAGSSRRFRPRPESLHGRCRCASCVARRGGGRGRCCSSCSRLRAWPPPSAEDGGWQLADQAAARVIREIPGAKAVELVGIPPFKSADALRFPLERRGVVPAAGGADPADTVVVVCDPLFDQVVGAPCGGPAESQWLAGTGSDLVLADRFTAGPRRVISIYGHAAP